MLLQVCDVYKRKAKYSYLNVTAFQKVNFEQKNHIQFRAKISVIHNCEFAQTELAKREIIPFLNFNCTIDNDPFSCSMIWQGHNGRGLGLADNNGQK